MGVAHPALDRAEGVFDRATAQRHRIGVAAQPLPHGVDQRLVLPASDPALRARGAAAFYGAGLAAVDPVAANLQAPFLTGIAIDEFVAGLAGRVARESGRGRKTAPKPERANT